MGKVLQRFDRWSLENPAIGALAIVVLFALVVLVCVFVVDQIDLTGYKALRTECLQYETIGDMPAKCLDVLD